MRPAAPGLSDEEASRPSAVESDESSLNDEARERQPRNFFVLALYHVVMRMGWIFKTESIIMPAVLDSIGGGAWLRGCLPLLNRFGQSVPPMLMARRIKVTPRKKWALASTTSLMSVSFLALSAVWFFSGSISAFWLAVVFLGLYGLFFVSTGVNQLCFGTLQGKLIEATHRGRLMLMANVFGAMAAITCAWLLLPRWLHSGSADFAWVFGFAGLCFAGSAVSSFVLAEPADNYEEPRSPAAEVFRAGWRTLRSDANFRRLSIISALFGCSMMLFPHYQALGRDGPTAGFDMLILWVIVQNAGTALFSMPAGPLADRYGNRLTLRLLLLGVCAAPLVALALDQAGDSGRGVYFLVFILVGLTPVTIRTLYNFALELCQPADHPRYLSTLSICMSAPIFLSPLVGLLIGVIGFAPVFLVISGIVLLGWLLTFGLNEPRHHYVSLPLGSVPPE